MFLEAGANPNHATPEFHHTPLMSAAAKGYVPIVEHLLKSGADINATTCDGLTALAIAQTKKRQDVVKILEDAGAGLGVPLPQPARIAWLAVDETGETCDHSAPEKVLRSFIFAMNRWEKNAAALRKAHPHDSGIGKRTLDEMEKVFSIFCTPIKRPYGRQGSYQIPPEYDPEEEFLIAVNIVDPRRVELITRQNKMKMEYLYVALKKKGRWLLDSKKSRMIGAKWNKAGL